MKNHFWFGYAGNKREEVEHIYDFFLKNILEKDDIKNIVESYCGTSALSYYISLKHPNKFTYYLNDNDKYLIELYNIVKGNKEDEFNEKINIMIDKFNSMTTDPVRKMVYLDLIKNDDVYSFLFAHKYYCIRAGLYPPLSRTKQIKPFKLQDSPIYDFVVKENIIFTNEDALNTIEKFKNDTSALCLLDPPYIGTTLKHYVNCNLNIYDYLYNNSIDGFKSHFVLIIENMWINELLFKKYVVDTYKKTYNTSFKKTSHIIVYNRKES